MRPRAVAIAQGAFYVATGLWPIVSLRTFELASGPKKEKWLVKTMGALITAVGGALLLRRNRPDAALGVLSAGAFAVCDVVYVAKGRIAKTYLVDAAIEVLLLGAWIAAMRRDRSAFLRRNRTVSEPVPSRFPAPDVWSEGCSVP